MRPRSNTRNHLESVKVRFSSILTKALPTNGPTDQQTNRPTDKTSYRDAESALRTHLKRYTVLKNVIKTKGLIVAPSGAGS